MMYSRQVHQYSSLSRLNTLEVYTQDTDTEEESHREKQGHWIVYIHGGAWRDPDIDASSIRATIPHLTNVTSHISGLASLSYRLSPYPRHSTNPSGDDPTRNVVHSAHIEDVLTALCWLQEHYKIGEQYVLVGHSAGATLAFQAVSRQWSAQERDTKQQISTFIAPVAIAGVAGIYDLKALVESFADIPAYRDIVEGAFGIDETGWNDASPTYLTLEKWKNGKVVVLADSKDDGLIDEIQSEKMWLHLKQESNKNRTNYRMGLQGDHDSIWSDGNELARVIIHTLNLVTESQEVVQVAGKTSPVD